MAPEPPPPGSLDPPPSSPDPEPSLPLPPDEPSARSSCAAAGDCGSPPPEPPPEPLPPEFGARAALAGVLSRRQVRRALLGDGPVGLRARPGALAGAVRGRGRMRHGFPQPGVVMPAPVDRDAGPERDDGRGNSRPALRTGATEQRDRCAATGSADRGALGEQRPEHRQGNRGAERVAQPGPGAEDQPADGGGGRAELGRDLAVADALELALDQRVALRLGKRADRENEAIEVLALLGDLGRARRRSPSPLPARPRAARRGWRSGRCCGRSRRATDAGRSRGRRRGGPGSPSRARPGRRPRPGRRRRSRRRRRRAPRGSGGPSPRRPARDPRAPAERGARPTAPRGRGGRSV